MNPVDVPTTPRAPFDEKNRAWGLMSIDEYAVALEKTLPAIWIPRFRAHGIDAAAAYRPAE